MRFDLKVALRYLTANHASADEVCANQQRLTHVEVVNELTTRGFVVEDLIEPRPGPDATSTYRDADALAWSRRWPAESIWRLRRS